MATFPRILRWFYQFAGIFLTSVFLARCCTASECLEFLLKVIYLPRFDFKPVNFLQVCCLLIDAASSWFLGMMQPKSSKTTGMRLVTVLLDGRFYPRIFVMFSKIAVFFGSNLFVTQKLAMYF